MSEKDLPPIPSEDQARAELRLATDEHVRRVVDAFPPLTREERARIAATLRRGNVSGGAA